MSNYYVYTAKELTIKGFLERVHPELVGEFKAQMMADTYLKRWVNRTPTKDLHLGTSVMRKWIAYYTKP